MRTAIFITMFMFSIAGCKKEVQVTSPKGNGSAPTTNTNSGSRADCEYYTQGIHSLSEFDALVSNNTYPLNLLSSDEKNDFRSGLVFLSAEEPSQRVVIGFKRGAAYSELTYAQYVSLIQLVCGFNPEGDTFENSYTENEELPYVKCKKNESPNTPTYNPPCIPEQWGHECCTIRISDVTSNCE